MELNENGKRTLAERFGQRLRSTRNEHGMTQRQLAQHLEVPEALVCRWERGVHLPSFENLRGLCQLFSVEGDYLLCRRGR